jgi:hypothetical protein
MAASSLELEFSLWEITEKANGSYKDYEDDDYWYLHEVRKNINCRSGRVTGINFKYLQQH